MPLKRLVIHFKIITPYRFELHVDTFESHNLAGSAQHKFPIKYEMFTLCHYYSQTVSSWYIYLSYLYLDMIYWLCNHEHVGPKNSICIMFLWTCIQWGKKLRDTYGNRIILIWPSVTDKSGGRNYTSSEWITDLLITMGTFTMSFCAYHPT